MVLGAVSAPAVSILLQQVFSCVSDDEYLVCVFFNDLQLICTRLTIVGQECKFFVHLKNIHLGKIFLACIIMEGKVMSS